MKLDPDHTKIKSIYRFIVGISYILQTGKKDQGDFKIATIKIANEKLAINFFDALLEYLSDHSVSLTDQSDMKNVVAIQLLYYLENAKLALNQNNAFKHMASMKEPENLVLLRDEVFNKYFKILLFTQNNKQQQQNN